MPWVLEHLFPPIPNLGGILVPEGTGVTRQGPLLVPFISIHLHQEPQVRTPPLITYVTFCCLFRKIENQCKFNMTNYNYKSNLHLSCRPDVSTPFKHFYNKSTTNQKDFESISETISRSWKSMSKSHMIFLAGGLVCNLERNEISKFFGLRWCWQA